MINSELKLLKTLMIAVFAIVTLIAIAVLSSFAVIGANALLSPVGQIIPEPILLPGDQHAILALMGATFVKTLYDASYSWLTLMVFASTIYCIITIWKENMFRAIEVIRKWHSLIAAGSQKKE